MILLERYFQNRAFLASINRLMIKTLFQPALLENVIEIVDMKSYFLL